MTNSDYGKKIFTTDTLCICIKGIKDKNIEVRRRLGQVRNKELFLQTILNKNLEQSKEIIQNWTRVKTLISDFV